MAETSRSVPTSQFPSPPAGAGAGGVWNEMTDSEGRIRPQWQRLSAEIHRWSLDERAAIAATAGRMIDDLGTTFNVFSDAGGAGQPYELDPIPLVIPNGEWAKVSAGIGQRIRLLNAVLADLYGQQMLLSEGLVPPVLVHSSPSFLPYARGVQPPGGQYLLASGCDLIRSPAGSWMVLRDHTSSPGGLGQAMENRKVIARLMADTFENLEIAPLGGFLEHEAESLRSLSIAHREGANIVFLTPGFRHPSYFEHAYKARLLGFPLVEPADLTVRERRLFLKTLAGLRRIDVAVCRIDHDMLDPLEHWGGRAGGGVPGIVEAWRTGNVALANAPGAGFASSPALLPFLPRICKEWFGEELKIPFVETWWLGQADVRRRVMDQLHRFVLMSASPDLDPLLPLHGSALSPAARKQWLSVIASRPHDFVVQADVRPSELPAIDARLIRQRPVVWRAFSVLRNGEPMVMPGGLARVGKNASPPQLWPGHAGFTKDVWISSSADSPSATVMKPAAVTQARHSSAHEVPSRIAEQLFWVGRYAERVELATRLLRVTLRCLGGESSGLQQERLAACISLLRGSALIPDGLVIHPARAMKTLSSLIHDPMAGGGIPALTRSLLLNAAAARDRLSDDTWRFFNRLEGIVNPPAAAPGTGELARTLDNLVLHLAAFAGMQAENMTRGHGWRFLEVGRRIERAIGVLALLKTAAAGKSADFQLLEPLLETCDSVMTYRRRHFSLPRLDAVIDLVFADPTNPRSVIYQIEVMHAEVARFPGRPDFGLMPRIREQADDLVARCHAGKPGETPDFEGLTEQLEHFSDSLTQHFFSHSVRRVY